MSIFEKGVDFATDAGKDAVNLGKEVEKLPARLKKQYKAMERKSRDLEREVKHQSTKVRRLSSGLANRVVDQMEVIDEFADQAVDETTRLVELAGALEELTETIGRMPLHMITTTLAYESSVRHAVTGLGPDGLRSMLDAVPQPPRGYGRALLGRMDALVTVLDGASERLDFALPVDLRMQRRLVGELVDVLPAPLLDELAGTLAIVDLETLTARLDGVLTPRRGHRPAATAAAATRAETARRTGAGSGRDRAMRSAGESDSAAPGQRWKRCRSR